MWRSIGKVNEHSNFQHQSSAACQRWSELTKCAITTQVTNDYNPIYLRPLRLFSQYTVVELTTKVSLIFKIVEIRKLLIFDHCAMGTVLMSCVMILAGMLIKMLAQMDVILSFLRRWELRRGLALLLKFMGLWTVEKGGSTVEKP